MTTTSLWKVLTPYQSQYPTLVEDIEVDVAIVGGGITGIMSALNFVKAGKKVAVFEANVMGGVTTSASTGNLYIPIQPYYQTILKKFDEETVATIAQSRALTIDYLEKIIDALNIHCNFHRRPWYLYTQDDKKIEFLEKEIETLQKANINIDFTQNLPFNLKFKKAAILENQARLDPLKFVLAVAKHLESAGCFIYENTRIVSIEEKNGCILKTANNTIYAKFGIIATHTPLSVNSIQFFTAPYRSYAVAAFLKDNHYPEAHIWDIGAPHHAFATHALTKTAPEILIISGNHHKTGQGEKNYFKNLETFLHKNFDIKEIAYQWSAQHFHAADSIPYIGLSHGAKYTYLATGFFADGLVYGTLSAILLSDLILQKENKWSSLYKPSRFNPKASMAFIFKENINVLKQYLKDFPFLIKRHTYLKAGEGKIIEEKGEKYGIYKDEENKIHKVSAVCTHMKCIVNWNKIEKTWDCPCHGSRFDINGKVLEGPAVKDLKKI